MHGDVSEGAVQESTERGRPELLDVLRIVSEPVYVLSAAEVAQPEEGFPRNGDHAVPAADSSQLLHALFRRSQMFKYLEARDDVSASFEEREHAGIGSHGMRGGKAPPRRRELVLPVLHSHERSGTRAHRLERETFPNANVDPDAVGRACRSAHFSQQPGDEPLHDRVGAGVLRFVLARCRVGRTRSQADGLRYGGSGPRAGWFGEGHGDRAYDVAHAAGHGGRRPGAATARVSVTLIAPSCEAAHVDAERQARVEIGVLSQRGFELRAHCRRRSGTSRGSNRDPFRGGELV